MIRYLIEKSATVVGRTVGALAQAVDGESKSQIRSDYNRVLRVCVCVISHLLILALFGLAVVVAYMLALGIPDGLPRLAFLGVELYGIWKTLWLLK
jgi:hypothetical protein